MGYQGMLIEIAKEYVVLATNQSQSLMCGGQVSCNKHAMDGWQPVEPQIVWNRSTVLNLPQPSTNKPECQHYAVSQIYGMNQLVEKASEEAAKPQLPPKNRAAQVEAPKDDQELPAHHEEDLCRVAPEKSAAAKSKKRFRIFRAVRSVIKSRFRK